MLFQTPRNVQKTASCYQHQQPVNPLRNVPSQIDRYAITGVQIGHTTQYDR
jgi:hypothetical protein